MKLTVEDIAAQISHNDELAEMLDSVLTESADRAYIICSANDCANNAEGKCTIHLVKGRRTVAGDGRCADHAS